MEDFVNKNLDEIHRYITEHDMETNWYAIKWPLKNSQMVKMMTIKKTENKNKTVVQRYITEN